MKANQVRMSIASLILGVASVAQADYYVGKHNPRECSFNLESQSYSTVCFGNKTELPGQFVWLYTAATDGVKKPSTVELEIVNETPVNAGINPAFSKKKLTLRDSDGKTYEAESTFDASKGLTTGFTLDYAGEKLVARDFEHVFTTLNH